MTVLANAHVVTMDDAGTELDSGWIRIEDGFVAEGWRLDDGQTQRLGGGLDRRWREATAAA